MQHVEDIATKFWLWAVGSLGAGIVWLVRRVLTNQRQVELLEAEVKRRGEDIKEIKADVKELVRNGLKK